MKIPCGYYIAKTRSMHGDRLRARLARIIWRSLGHRAPGRFDGVTVSGYRVIVVMRSFFNMRTVCYPPCSAFQVDDVARFTIE